MLGAWLWQLTEHHFKRISTTTEAQPLQTICEPYPVLQDYVLEPDKDNASRSWKRNFNSSMNSILQVGNKSVLKYDQKIYEQMFTIINNQKNQNHSKLLPFKIYNLLLLKRPQKTFFKIKEWWGSEWGCIYLLIKIVPMFPKYNNKSGYLAVSQLSIFKGNHIHILGTHLCLHNYYFSTHKWN